MSDKQRFQQYTETLNDAREKRDKAKNELAIALKEIKELKEENKRYKQALEFYADEDN